MNKEKLKVEYLPLNEIHAYENNAKLHPEEQIEQIKESIDKFGFNDPIGIWGPDNTIVEGHGRYIAATELKLKEVPVIRLDELTDEQRKAYTLVHNKLTMNSGFDFDALQEELDSLSEADFDMADFGFDDMELPDIDEMFGESEPKDNDDSKNETHMIKCPHCGEMIEVDSNFNPIM